MVHVSAILVVTMLVVMSIFVVGVIDLVVVTMTVSGIREIVAGVAGCVSVYAVCPSRPDKFPRDVVSGRMLVGVVAATMKMMVTVIGSVVTVVVFV